MDTYAEKVASVRQRIEEFLASGLRDLGDARDQEGLLGFLSNLEAEVESVRRDAERIGDDPAFVVDGQHTLPGYRVRTEASSHGRYIEVTLERDHDGVWSAMDSVTLYVEGRVMDHTEQITAAARELADANDLGDDYLLLLLGEDTSTDAGVQRRAAV